MLVLRTNPVPFECVVRGYISGSAWNEYRDHGTLAGEKLPLGLVQSSRLEPPIFSPATKAESGHDINVTFDAVAKGLGAETAARLRDLSFEVYRAGATHASERGIIIADTKFEFGILNGKTIWIDEALTPDSSRFWPASAYRVGSNPPSYDKQFVRDWLESTGWDKNPPAPELPPDVVAKTREKYIEAFRVLTGSEPEL
jgi:phosphoribosylaminoimidazole-succinocarboxamide synthase